MPKVARVIYNRLETGRRAPTACCRSTRPSTTRSTSRARRRADRASDLELRLAVQHLPEPGLPPAPIDSPGEAAIEAAINPADGDWLYFVTVNLETGETKFAETYDEFLRVQAASCSEYCETESDGAC